jgi:hypothetical protein
MKLIATKTPLLLLALGALAATSVLADARRTIDEHQPADATGQVEINNVSGRVEVVGWAQPEVAVTGTVGRDVEKVEVSGSGGHTVVRVVHKNTFGIHLGFSAGDANLVVHVPQGSSLNLMLVSSDLRVHDVQGNQQIQTVSGDVDVAATHDVRIQTVSGEVKLAAGPDSHTLEIRSTSGDLHVNGGGGEVTINTVSGDGTIALGTVSRVKVKTVSGDFNLAAALAADGRFEAESVSGDLVIAFTGGVPPAEFELKSFSGDLSTCFGRKPVHEGYGPGSRLSFQEGAGSGHVRVDTMSGDVSLCTR